MRNKIAVVMLLVASSLSMRAADSQGVYAINISDDYVRISFKDSNGQEKAKLLRSNMKLPVQLSYTPITDVAYIYINPLKMMTQGLGKKLSGTYKAVLIEIVNKDKYTILSFKDAAIKHASLKGIIEFAVEYVDTGLYAYIINKTGAVLKVKDKPGFAPTTIKANQAAKVLMRAPTKISSGGSVTLIASTGEEQKLKRETMGGIDICGYEIGFSSGSFQVKPLDKLDTYKNSAVMQAQSK